VDVKQVGRELGVRYILEGSVRKAGKRVRISGQLVDTDSGAHLWADRFDGGLEDIEVQLPAVVTADLRLNEPRYASLPGIMKARKKELKEIPVADLGIDVAPKVQLVKMDPPPKRQAGKKVASVEELVNLLHTEAKVI